MVARYGVLFDHNERVTVNHTDGFIQVSTSENQFEVDFQLCVKEDIGTSIVCETYIDIKDVTYVFISHDHCHITNVFQN
jgi:hypothetical protein